MVHFLTSDEKYRDLPHDDDYRSYLGDRGDQRGGYRFGRMRGKRIRIHVRSALGRVNGYLKNLIEAIANAKLRRMERELELRGIHFDRADDNGVTRNSDRTSRRED
jgi:hypothetical protein